MNQVKTVNKVVHYIEQWSQNRAEPVCAFIYDIQGLREHAALRVQSLPKRCRLFYAIKANSDMEILKQLAGIVHGFEAASLGEILKIRELLGLPSRRS